MNAHWWLFEGFGSPPLQNPTPRKGRAREGGLVLPRCTIGRMVVLEGS